MVFYRKYRPQTIDELDLALVRERLSSILKAKELPHAFLFTGPKGLGKTSAARILAKAINCERRKTEDGKRKTDSRRQKTENPKSQSSVLRDLSSVISPPSSDIEPCNVCDACVSITNGSNLDVLEIDAASNRGIDEIRDLREKIKFSPSNLSKKVYIIDEVHMLTQDAFSALLKTLEEPPSHAVFVLCTTEEEKVPPTIVSRCFQIKFQKPTKKEILRSIERIIKSEKLNVEEGVLDEIYGLSEGSFRDGAKILEELSIIAEGKINRALLEKAYKTGGIESSVKDLLIALSQKDLKKAIMITQNLAESGSDFKIITERIANYLHDLILKRTGIDSDMQDIEGLNTSDLKRLLDMINESYRDIKFSVLPQIPLELVVVEWCLPQKVEDRKQKTDTEIQKTEDRKVNQSSVVQDPSSVVRSQSSGGMFAENAKSDNFMAALLSAVKQDNHSIAGILRGCRLIEILDEKVQFETKYKFHRDKLNDPKTTAIIDKRASEILKRNIRVIVEMATK